MRVNSADIAIKNVSELSFGQPFHALVHVNGSNVNLPDAKGGVGVGPYDTYYFDLGDQLNNGELKPGEEISFQLYGESPSGFTYDVTVVSAPIKLNAPPSATDLSITVEEDSFVNLVLEGSDPEGEALAYSLTASPSHGTLTGELPALVYTPDQNYYGTDSFRYTVFDGEKHSNPAVVEILVIEKNEAPTIVSEAPITVSEGDRYSYFVKALDPDPFDTLSFSISSAPPGVKTDLESGVITWDDVPQKYTGNNLRINKQCYVVPAGFADVLEEGDNPEDSELFLAPLYQKVNRALDLSAKYTAVQTRAWTDTENCLGCHVQTQSLYGLSTAATKVDVDPKDLRYLSNTISNSIQSDGIYISDRGERISQTTLAMWALGPAKADDNVFWAKLSGANILIKEIRESGNTAYWSGPYVTQPWWWHSSNNINALGLAGLSNFYNELLGRETLPTRYVKTWLTDISAQAGSSSVSPEGLATDSKGNMYLTASSADKTSTVFKINIETKQKTTFATGLPEGAVGLSIDENNNLFIAGSYGDISKISSDGEVSILYSGGGTYVDLDFGPDGLLWALDYDAGKIVRHTPSGTLVDELELPTGTRPTQIDFKSDGTAVLSTDSRTFLQIDRDLKIDTFIEGLTSKVWWSFVDSQDNTWFSASSTNRRHTRIEPAIYKASPSGYVQLVYRNYGFRGITEYNGNLYALAPSVNKILQITPDPLDLQRYDAIPSIIEKVSRRLINVQISNSYNTGEAVRVIGLAAAASAMQNENLAKAALARTDKLVSVLKSRQNSDGGWGNSRGQVSDPLVTALVGLAIATKNPGLEDKSVIATINYLLDAQNDDGSWDNINNGLKTRLSSTSLVMAYLPVALEFLGNPDLAVSDLNIDEKNTSLNVTIMNRGIADIDAQSTVDLYNGESEKSELLGSLLLEPVPAGESRKTSLQLNDLEGLGQELYVKVHSASKIEECENRNNEQVFPVIRHRVTDSRGLFDEQIYAINVRDTNSPPIITSTNEIIHQQGQSKSLLIESSDEDLGDSPKYTLDGAPEGVTIDSRTGQIYTNKEVLTVGDYTFTVIAEDLEGFTSEQELSFSVKPNLPPQIISTPVQQSTEGQKYFYDVDATDPNNDVLTYFAPGLNSFVIGAETGIIEESVEAPLEPLRISNNLCQSLPKAGDKFEVVPKWSWLSSDHVGVFGPVAVGQVNDDNGDGVIDARDNPDLVFNRMITRADEGSGELVALSGIDGSLLWAAGAGQVTPMGSPAIADIDGDSLIEVIVPSATRQHFYVYEHDGSFKFAAELASQPTPIRYGPRDAISVADINHDGSPEIIYGRDIYDASGNHIVSGEYQYGGDVDYGIISLVADIDMQGDMEIIAGRLVYKSDGELLWRNLDLPAKGMNAVGNFDEDEWPEIVFVGEGKVYLLEHDGTIKWGPTAIPGGGKGGTPTIADLDGDGWPEIGVAGAANYVAIETDGTLKWANRTIDQSSNRTGSSVFDFEGDGKVEVVYADELSLYIYDGESGDILLEIPNESATTLEYPVIVDIDNDGHAEIIAGSTDLPRESPQSKWGLRVFEAANDDWAPTRSIWNQHAYHITNINDDGTVPQFEEHSWLSHNTYRLNTFIDRNALAQSDLAAFEVKFHDNSQSLTAVIKNRGAAPTSGNTLVEVFTGNPEDGGLLLGEVTIDALAANEEQTITLDNITEDLLLGSVVVRVNYSGTIDECNTENNTTSAIVKTVSVMDEGGLTDTQTFLLSTINANDPPLITTLASVSPIGDEDLSLQLDIEDPDLGDAHTFKLVTAPEGVTIDRHTGRLSAEPFTLSAGIYSLAIEVKDLSGDSDEINLALTVTQPDNTPPAITSTPGTTAEALFAYSYQLSAEDIDGDEVAFMLAQRPDSMVIDGTQGLITWEPAYEDIGVHHIQVVAIDDRGASSKQSFFLEVSDPFANNKAPVISSKPSGTIVAGREFSYQVIATDPDGDPLSYELKDAGDTAMKIDAQGVFTWVPANSSIGNIETVTIVVRDNKRGAAEQSLALPVSEPTNKPPVIISTPTNTATVNKLYVYALEVQDPDGDEVSLSLEQLANGMSLSAGNELLWRPSEQQSQQTFDIAIRAVDERGASSTQYFQIGVDQQLAANTPPVFISAPSSPAFIGEVYSYEAIARDADGDAVTFSLLNTEIDGIELSSQGQLNWTPNEAQLGDHLISILVSDGKAAVSQDFQLRVVAPADLTNAYPVVESQPVTQVLLGDEYRYRINASDADGDDLIYTLLNNTNEAISLAEDGLITWMPGISDLGSTNLMLRVSDGQLSVVQSWSVDVISDAPPLEALVSVSPQDIQLGDTVEIAVSVTGGIGNIDSSVFVDGEKVELDAQGRVTLTANSFGFHPIRVVASTVNESIDESFHYLVIDPNDDSAPIAIINLPSEGSEITRLADITGTANDANLVNYELYISPIGRNMWSLIGEGSQPVLAGKLGELDPTMLTNGQYDLALQARDVNNRISSDFTRVVVDGDLKVGNFSFTVEDLNIPMVGIPIQVTRTYDSRRRNELLDFGYGWSIDYQNVKVEESRVPGKYWGLNQYGRFVAEFCVEPLGAPLITVTLPDGEVEKFEMAASPRCMTMSVQKTVDLVFNPVGDNQSKLEAIGETQGYLKDGHLVETGHFLNPVNPDKYKLTTKAGYVYFLDQGFGVEKVVDPNGHTLTYTNDGIFHSSGKSIEFRRNSRGLIEKIVDPSGEELRYLRAGNNDLDKVYDRDDSESRYTYNRNHGLLEMFDGLGRKIVKNLYDEKGRLYAQEDGEGNIKTFDHDLDANASVVTDRDDRQTTFIYDDLGNVLSETLLISDGSYDSDIQTTYGYDDHGNQTSRTIGESTWLAGFNARNDQLFATDPEGNTVKYNKYNKRGQEEEIEDELGRKHEMDYDDLGNLISIKGPQVTDPDTGVVTQGVATTEINRQGLPESTTDMGGLTTTYTYYLSGPNKGQKQTESNPLSGTTTYTYDGNNNVATETRVRSVDGELIDETTRYEYDSRDRLIKTTYADGSYSRTVYDLAGNVDKERDRLGNWTDFEYDAYGRLVETQYANGTKEVREYTKEGLLKRVTEPGESATRNEYDDAGRLWKTINEADNSYREMRYTLQGWLRSEVDEEGNLQEYQYDKAGKRTKVIRHFLDTNGNPQTLEHSYDYYDNGELKSETDALQHTMEYVINELDQRIETRYHNGSVIKYRYDIMGRKIAQVDQLGRRTRFDMDKLGRLVGVTPEVQINGEDVPATTYSYDEHGNKLTQTDANQNTTAWTYDDKGRVLTRTLPGGQSERFEYNDAELKEVHTDFNGDTTTTFMDNMGRVSRVSYSKDGREESYTYWPNGQVKTVTETTTGGVKVTQYFYDERQRLSYKIQPDGSRLDYDYDKVGNRTAVKVSRANIISSHTSYTFDQLNRLATVNNELADDETTRYAYDKVGNLDTVTHANGLVTDYDYNTINQLTDVFTRAADDSVLSHYHYTLDASGRRRVITELDGRTTAYCYDALYRLTDEVIFNEPVKEITQGCLSDTSGADYTANYQYDWVGNRIYETVDGVQTAYRYDNNDRLEQSGGSLFSYDDNGNTLTETLDGVVTSYYYDGRNAVQRVDVDGAVIAEFDYDEHGIRTSKTENGETINYVVDANRAYAQVLEEYVEGNLAVSYSYGHDLLTQERGDNIYYYHYDGLGSTRALSDISGIYTDTYDYEAFGELLSQSGETENNYLFTGEQYDGALDQYYLRARYYDQGIGWFTQMDTWMGHNSDPVTLHKYLYANADPAYFVDPSGNISIGSLGTAIAITSILTTSINVGTTIFGGQVITKLDSDQIPDAAIFSIVGSVGSGGAMAEANGDIIVDLRSGRTYAYGGFGAGLSPISLFKRYKSASTTKSVGLIWNFNNPNEWSGLGIGANWPFSIVRLLPASLFSSNKMWGAMTQLAKREKNVRRSDITVNITVSTSGPAAIRVSQRVNSFSSSVGYTSKPIELPTSRFLDVAKSLANDFGNSLNEL